VAKAKVAKGFNDEEQYERYKDDLARALEGAIARKAELEEMKTHPDELSAADEAISEIRKQIISAGGKPAASKRPAKAEEKR